MIYYPHISASWDDFVYTAGYSMALSDVISCTVTEERNGMFDLEMEYPFGGENARAIDVGAIIAAKPFPGSEPEPFRIYSVNKDINGVLHVLAHSAVYDADGIVLEPFTASDSTQIVTALNNHTDPTGVPAFRVSTSSYLVCDLEIETPTSLFTCLGLAAKAMHHELGYHYNRYTQQFDITLYSSRGVASQATVAYGVNLTSMSGYTDSSGVYTDIFPYYYSEGTLVELPEKTVSTGIIGIKRVLAVDLSSDFDHVPTEAELRTQAGVYVSENSFGYVTSTSFDFVPLASTTEYNGMSGAQAVNLCDTIRVQASPIGVSVTAKVTKTVYNTLLDKYDSMTVGDIRQNVADTIARLERME